MNSNTHTLITQKLTNGTHTHTHTHTWNYYLKELTSWKIESTPTLSAVKQDQGKEERTLIYVGANKKHWCYYYLIFIYCGMAKQIRNGDIRLSHITILLNNIVNLNVRHLKWNMNVQECEELHQSWEMPKCRGKEMNLRSLYHGNVGEHLRARGESKNMLCSLGNNRSYCET